jgi:NADPH:quinone reductase-like Zn-dependent oxidoreductase
VSSLAAARRTGRNNVDERLSAVVANDEAGMGLIIPLIVGGSVKPIVERVYPLGEAGGALRHLIEDRPFGKVILAG